MFVHVKALESFLQTNRRLPVNVKCLFEGEEEIGSPQLKRFLVRNRAALSADVAVMSDMPIPGPNRPAITYALRGGLSLELEVTGLDAPALRAFRRSGSQSLAGAVRNHCQLSRSQWIGGHAGIL